MGGFRAFHDCYLHQLAISFGDYLMYIPFCIKLTSFNCDDAGIKAKFGAKQNKKRKKCFFLNVRKLIKQNLYEFSKASRRLSVSSMTCRKHFRTCEFCRETLEDYL